VARVRHLDRDDAAIREAQREVSRKKKGSSNRTKAVRRLNRLHEKVASRRKDHIEKQTARLASSYGFLAVEALSVKGMSHKGGARKRGLNRSMADASLGRFLARLAGKAEEAGCEFVEVDPKGTTQQCSNCGRVVAKTLYDRIHACKCGLVMDRDLNAAVNILFRGLALAGREPPELWRDVRLEHITQAVPLKQETTPMPA